VNRDVRFANVEDAPRLAHLHIERINEGFLASLGPTFLTSLYSRVARSGNAFAVVAEDGGEIVAFCAAAENVRRFYAEFMTRDGLIAGLRSAPRLVRAVPHVLETLRYPSTTGGLPQAEILAVVADERVAGQGYASQVLHHALKELTRRGCDTAKVVAGADNRSALRLYARCGFATTQSISIHDDIPSEVLVWARS
jgi:ribosomal protein S18 acetylase RimI-like enzyme